jgi:OPA family glycerol-3-phosphate transporter-like MFS transporter
MSAAVPSEFRESAYRLRRFQNWITIGFLYSLFYMTRYNFSAVSPWFKEAFGWVKTDMGYFEFAMPFAYGLAVIFNGPLSDRIGGKKAFLIGAAGVVVMNFLFGMSHVFIGEPAQWMRGPDGELQTLVSNATYLYGFSHESFKWLLIAVWTINGYFQSFGALSIVKINAQWFHVRERGTFAAIFGVLIRFGLILSFSGCPFIARVLPWYWAFWIPACLVAFLWLLTLLLVKDTPKQAGFDERDTGDDAPVTEEKVKLGDILRKVFASKVMWTIAVGSMMIGFVRRSSIDASWFPLYFKEYHHAGGASLSYQVAAWGIALGGIAGGFVFGIMSDKIYKGRRAPVVVYGFLGMAATLGLFMLSDRLALGAVAAAMWVVLLSFFVNGAHGMIGGAASMDFGGRKAAATAAGLFDGVQYFIAAPSALVVGYITEHYGWQVWKLWPIPFALLGGVVMATLWNAVPKGRGGSH